MKTSNQNLKIPLTQGEPVEELPSPHSAVAIQDIQIEFMKCIAKEIGIHAIEFLTIINPDRPQGKNKITNEYFCKIEPVPIRQQPSKRIKSLQELLYHLRQLNKSGQDIYFRPCHSQSNKVANECCIQYPYFVLDDVDQSKAKEIAKRHSCLVVKTSEEGGCQVWVICNKPIGISTRHKLQKHFADQGIADVGATSGIQYFRCPGFKNHKRAGQWANLIHKPKKSDTKFNVDEFIKEISNTNITPATFTSSSTKIINIRANNPIANSQSEQDWHDVCTRLTTGDDIDQIIDDLRQRSVARGKHSSYAKRTVMKAAIWMGLQKK